jgi:ATP-dependent Clp protease ATP-binding subunit ClpB
VIVMTSNLGSQRIQQLADEGDYQVLKLAVMAEVKNFFRPEFINRIDEVVVFHPLKDEHIAGIARIQLERLEKRLARHDMALKVTDAALMEIAKVGYDPVYGARPLKRAIQEHIENPLAKYLLEGRFGPKDTIVVDVRGGQFVFEKG